jgi:hypothetical protein
MIRSPIEADDKSESRNSIALNSMFSANSSMVSFHSSSSSLEHEIGDTLSSLATTPDNSMLLGAGGRLIVQPTAPHERLTSHFTSLMTLAAAANSYEYNHEDTPTNTTSGDPTADSTLSH